MIHHHSPAITNIEKGVGNMSDVLKQFVTPTNKLICTGAIQEVGSLKDFTKRAKKH